MKRVVVIGSGLGGLECAFILAGRGMDVTVLERSARPGGCLQGFTRGGIRFDTGFHCVGGLGKGGALRKVMEYFGLIDLPWRRLDPEGAEEVVIGRDCFVLPSGFEAYGDALCGFFPSESDAVHRFVGLLEEVSLNILETSDGDRMALFRRGALQYLEETFRDPLLRKVVSGTSLKMELTPQLPLYPFAEINGSYVQGVWQLEGGGDAITARLLDGIAGRGGVLRTGAEVVGIIESGGCAAGVELSDGEVVPADLVISDAPPAVTVSLLGKDSSVRSVYRRRVSSLAGTYGMFTANIVVDGGFPVPERNIYVHCPGADLWRTDLGSTGSVMVHPYPGGGRLDILSPMYAPEERGEAYEGIKRKKLSECLDLAEQALPGLKEAAKLIYTSTPLTWQESLGLPGGAAYGLRKDFSTIDTCLLSPRTPLRGLFLTGSGLALHGVLGTSMTALRTCSAILGESVI
ncbi:MAG: NAD(P)/FAD-dependent oxidoreductase [Bacteroidales bacterium]|nr:NAD(P)/FAD-dependent oxidoreductase [Bacteroidales bacterium]